MSVKAKKHLGQHFLTDELIAQQIADSLVGKNYKNVLEIGPGMGVLTKYLLKKDYTTHVIEIDTESVEYLQAHYLNLADRIISKDFLRIDISEYMGEEPFAIIGNFPYNISSQIVFKTLENRHQIPELSGMFQKDVAFRIAEKANCKFHKTQFPFGIVTMGRDCAGKTCIFVTHHPAVAEACESIVRL